MHTPTTADRKQADSVERRVLEKLRLAYEVLREASAQIDKHHSVLSRCGSPLADGTSDGPSVGAALEAIHAIGGELHARRKVPFPDQDASYQAMDHYFKASEEARERWMGAAYYLEMARSVDPF